MLKLTDFAGNPVLVVWQNIIKIVSSRGGGAILFFTTAEDRLRPTNDKLEVRESIEHIYLAYRQSLFGEKG